jgi:hypothetical protein
MKISTLLCAACIETTCGATVALPLPAQMPLVQVEHSDTVIVGKLRGPTVSPAKSYHTKAVVEEIWKTAGGVRVGDIVDIDLSPEPHMRLLDGDHAILILRCSGAIQCAVVDPFWPALPALPSASAATTSDAVDASIANMLVRVAVASDAEISAARGAGHRLPNYSGTLRRDCIRALMTFPDQLVKDALQGSVASPDVDSRMARAALGMRLGQFADLDSIQQSMLADDLPGAAMRKFIASQMNIAPVSPDVLPSMMMWTQSKDKDVRFSAAYMLRRLKLPATVKGLIAGLRDSDVDIRYQSAAGLYETFDEGPAPTPDSVAKPDSPTISFWLDRASSLQEGR